MNPERWREVERLYHEARKCSDDERALFLEESCAGDESLRQEVESLLACRPAAEELMASPALDAAVRELAREQSGETEADLTGCTLIH